MNLLTDNDYATLKAFTLEELRKYREDLQEKLFNRLTGDQHNTTLEEIDELIIWINAYANEIISRTAISTPPCKD